ncbi:MAG TPA: ATP-binding cassette domain-containing protein [Bryobacteraceae bacterium]|nr:ATP-binding cassette domain-containing protein [Bryobacteraceae bacterium]
MSAREGSAVPALQSVSVSVGLGETLGIVGRSGAGKSTLARCLACLELPDFGQIWFDGQNLLGLPAPQLITARRHIQLIFQQSAATLNPRFSAIQVVTEPVTIARSVSKKEGRELGLRMMESVGLPREAANRRCTEFSGGERQRLAIARALTLSPRVLVLDEALTGLDLLIQAQLVNLLLELQASRSMTYIFISHDLPLTAHVADSIAVMHGGRVVEQGPAERVLHDPQHPHTRDLLAAVAQLRIGT